MSDNIELAITFVTTYFISSLAPEILDPDPENFTTNEKGGRSEAQRLKGPGE